ncbi:DUF1456 family protein [Vagococcus coleopterorum]
MNNNDKLVRLRYALDLKDQDMAKIFKLGGADLSVDEVKAMLKRVYTEDTDEFDDNKYEVTCNDRKLEMFLNGFITFKRGKRPLKPGEVEKPVVYTMNHGNGNNELLKKLKIALSMTSDDMLEVFDHAGMRISASELGAVLRKEGARNYQRCGDKFARNFIKGLTVMHRGDK